MREQTTKVVTGGKRVTMDHAIHEVMEGSFA